MMHIKESLTRSDQPQFSDESKQVLKDARVQAAMLGHNYIGTEHILFALTLSEDPDAENLGVDLIKTRNAVHNIIGRTDTIVSAENLIFTPRAKEVIYLSADEARRMNYPFVLRVHLFLGLLREGQGIGSGVLESMGFSLDITRAKVLESISRDPIYKAFQNLNLINIFLTDPTQDPEKKKQIASALESTIKLISSEN